MIFSREWIRNLLKHPMVHNALLLYGVQFSGYIFPLLTLPYAVSPTDLSLGDLPPLTHLISIERVGPSHTIDSLRRQPGATPQDIAAFEPEVPAAHRDRCHTMKGRDITDQMVPAHLLFEHATSGGMIPWVRRARRPSRGPRRARTARR